MNEGTGMKQSLNTTDKQGAGTFFTQYNRIHNKLGAALGPGVPREYPVREAYNPITGMWIVICCLFYCLFVSYFHAFFKSFLEKKNHLYLCCIKSQQVCDKKRSIPNFKSLKLKNIYIVLFAFETFR